MTAKTIQERFVTMINDANPGLNLSLDDITITGVTSYTPADSSDRRNTEAEVTALPESNFTGTKKYHFFRFPFTGDSGPSFTEDQSLWEDDQYVLDKLNAKGLPAWGYLSLEDVAITRTLVDDVLNVRVDIKDGHLSYFGWANMFVKPAKYDLSAANGELSGFKM